MSDRRYNMPTVVHAILLLAVMAMLMVPALASVCADSEVTYTLTMTDTYGDGWNDAVYTLIQSSDGSTSTGTLATGAYDTAALCLAPADDGECHTFEVSAGSYPSEVGWSIAGEGGTVVGEGGAPTTASVCFQPPPSPAPSISPQPSVSLAPSVTQQCDVWLDGANDGYQTSRLGSYAFQGYDESGAPYYKSEDDYFMYRGADGFWYVSDEMDGTGGWASTTSSSSSPLDVATWQVVVDGSWTAQPGVAAICATPAPSPAPSVSLQPSVSPCDVWLGGANDGYLTSRLGSYAFEGYDESGAPYYRSEDGDFMYRAASGYWYVGSEMEGGGWWSSTTASSSSPLDVAAWEVLTDGSWIAQPSVTAVCVSPAPSLAPSISPQPSSVNCNVNLGGANDGFHTEYLGLYEYQGFDANGTPYYRHESGAYFMYLRGDGEQWYVGTVLGEESVANVWWFGWHVTNSPADVAIWKVWGEDKWTEQPDVTVTGVTGGGTNVYPPECWLYTPDPTSSPVPTATASPTRAWIIVNTDATLRAAVEGAVSDDKIVVERHIALTATLWFPEGLTGVVLRGNTPGTTLSGDGTFRLIGVDEGTELDLEDLVLTEGYASSSGGALWLGEGVVLRVRRCTFSHNHASNNGGAITTYNAYIIVEDSHFELNEAIEGSGGAMRVYSDSHATIHRTTFAKNKAGALGGGVSFAHNRPWEVPPSIVEDCLFDLNNASNYAGGGMDVTTASTTVHVSNTQYRHNYAGQSGGAVSASNDATLTVADSVMANNAAGDAGGSASATAAKLTFVNVNVTDSVAGRAGGAVAIAGDSSTGAFRGTNFGNCTASTLGGAIAASGDVPELTIEGAALLQCRVEEQGGALHVDGTGVLRVANTSFEDSTVGYSTTPVCLTLTMIDMTGDGWQGAELFVFRKEDYDGEAVYGCPETCTTGSTTGSCDFKDYYWGTDSSTCDHSGDALTTEYQCDCSGCVCSGYEPPSHTYLHRFALADGFSATEQVCFERNHGRGEYVILVTDDKWPSAVQWTLEGYVVDGGTHDLRHLDFTTLESKDGCEAPGEPRSVGTKQKHQ